MILAGDVGGTKSNLALIDLKDGRPTITRFASFVSREFSGLDAVAAAFLNGNREITSACFGVPGPVVEGTVRITNLPWLLNVITLQAELKLKTVYLINDLEAAAYGLSLLAPEDLLVLNAGTPRPAANAALLAAGTGLGESLLYWNGQRRVPVATEGGHTDFAPNGDLQFELLRYLSSNFGGHVSWERVVSGPGLFNIYSFLKDTGRGTAEPWLAEHMQTADPAAVISEAALGGKSEICVQALDILVAAYGAEAGNLGLRALARGGVYVGGGVAPKIAKKLQDGTFMKAFLDKGRISDFMPQLPVYVVMNEKTPLFGAAQYVMLKEELAHAGGVSRVGR